LATILVVDDEECILSVLERHLRSNGYRVLTATSSREAEQLAHAHQPDLAILDIIMPGGSGMDLCCRIRQAPELQQMMVIFLTQRSNVEDRIEGLHAGADDYLPKPFEVGELLARVDALLRRRQREEEGRESQTSQRLQVGPLSLNTHSRQLLVEGEPHDLTPVQRDLLAHLMSHADQPQEYDQLLQQVWGMYPGTGAPSLVRWHVSNLRDIVERDPSEPQVLVTIPGLGYLLRSNPYPPE
jgi:DNA-binding response OmpR family regulator